MKNQSLENWFFNFQSSLYLCETKDVFCTIEKIIKNFPNYDQLLYQYYWDCTVLTYYTGPASIVKLYRTHILYRPGYPFYWDCTVLTYYTGPASIVKLYRTHIIYRPGLNCKIVPYSHIIPARPQLWNCTILTYYTGPASIVKLYRTGRELSLCRKLQLFNSYIFVI